MKFGILQLNYRVGDFRANAAKIMKGYDNLNKSGAEIIIATELAILGYPPRDLLERRDILERQNLILKEMLKVIGDVPLILGVAEKNQENKGKGLFNSAAVLRSGKIERIFRKSLLPTYDVFDEHRYFEEFRFEQEPWTYKDQRIAIFICEDIWNGTEDPYDKKDYDFDPVEKAAVHRPTVAVVLNSSPYHWGKGILRFRLVQKVAETLHAPVLYINQVGGNDELIFDGRSFAVNSRGECMACGQAFEESTFILDTDTTSLFGFPSDEGDISQIYKSLVLGLRDYRTKTGTFDSGVVIGLSGGIDSAITAVLATAAFGPEKVMCIGMPSEFSSQGSIDDAKTLAKNLGVSFEIIPIHEPYEAFLKALRPLFDDLPFDIAEENIQARCRGLILMAISNKFNRLLLATGNKSEMAVGYSTLYGDMAGGLSVISDVYKTEVYRIAEWINRDKEIIPRNIITKEPSAELRENQRDTDSLPPYQTVLDPILKLYIDQNKGKEQIIREGFDKEIVEQICGMVDRNEFKRRQAAPGLKVTSKAFGMGRRMPIAAKF